MTLLLILKEFHFGIIPNIKLLFFIFKIVIGICSPIRYIISLKRDQFYDFGLELCKILIIFIAIRNILYKLTTEVDKVNKISK